ncbi:MAG: phytoene/squalene synthase family protein [Saprospiraceae bacterium]|nr:phytoene/squalene synthase family protein [Saprospiraceae bacterium]HMW40514.1 phytoene/squalene synthase family protein [Saprospiraceae bacterium]HMX89128.1 phytoene/squalene synthase family protein [Saprospiraceae bacterium]HMZ41086.1 phytoene/squalene synthase family protein [Saprospiraceae bacterium]HNA65877.1 phytoene/squalene synthase family protein [Saprospiraceae bacterium]
MDHIELYHRVCNEISLVITHRYSTSFSMGIRMFASHLRSPVCAIYGFVRIADEIVDTFHHVDQATILSRFKEDTSQAIAQQYSTNPVLHSFARTVSRYKIEQKHIDAFLHSMEMDLTKRIYNREEFNRYVYGSAEVVGLFCLKVFLDGDESKYNALEGTACALGSAFQKINFLRDLKSDFEERGRIYFPGVNPGQFTESEKEVIEEEIAQDFAEAYRGIADLPVSVRKGVLLAYHYYLDLFRKIKGLSSADVLNKRIRISNFRKFQLMILVNLGILK